MRKEIKVKYEEDLEEKIKIKGSFFTIEEIKEKIENEKSRAKRKNYLNKIKEKYEDR